MKYRWKELLLFLCQNHGTLRKAKTSKIIRLLLPDFLFMIFLQRKAGHPGKRKCGSWKDWGKNLRA
jgi:hypothetical protein